MDQQPNVPFSEFWEWLSRRLGLGSDRPPGGGNVRPIRRRSSRRLKAAIIIAAIIVVLFVLLPSLIYYYTEWLWFGGVGYTGVFWKILLTKAGLGLAYGAFFFLVVYGNVLLARRLTPKYRIGQGSEIIERTAVPDRLMRWLIPLALAAPSLIALGAGVGGWQEFLKFVNRTDFGVIDPVFNHDVGFYVFTLPFLRMMQSLVWWTLIFTLLATLAIHFFDFAIDWREGHLNFAPHVRAHLSVLMGLIMFTFAAGYLLKGYVLMFSSRGVVFGASYTDVHAQLPVFRFLAATAVVAGVLFLINIHFRGWKLPAAALAIIVLTEIFGGWLYPFVVQQYTVSPNELEKEKPYIKNNIDFTRQAFDLNAIDAKPFTASANLTAADIQQNINTVDNVRLWDPATLGETYGQIQTIRPYYQFADVDVDRYTFGGREQEVMLSPREINVDNLDPRAQTWQNQHMVYTHGYGVVMSPVAQASSEGLPQLIVKDIPPASTVPEIQVNQPAIYYGEEAGNYALVNTDIKEFDYPQGDQNVYSVYGGSGGVNVGSFINRIAFGVRFGSLKLLVSSAIHPDSRILFHRQISDRIKNIAPFLRYDQDPYSVVVNGRVYWIQDAYTTSDSYPYSQPSKDGVNYIRNSVKVVVDAYNGSVTFYVVDNSDPLIRTYEKMFPGLFTPGDRMPESLRAHLRYPEDLFRMQADMYTTYHMTDPEVFYNKEDQWQMPRQQSGNITTPIDPYYVIMSLPGENREQFMLMLPFTPKGKDNMIAWMAAKCDPGSYGQRVVFKFPKDKLVYGPTQVQSRFNQDPAISAQISLWNQSGSQVQFGNLLVIPINESLLYVQPLYLKAAQSQIPELKQVLVSFGDKETMQDDLSKALAAIFGAPISGAPQKPGGVTTTPVTPAQPQPGAPPASLKDLANQALTHYNNAVQAEKNGDWATYGSELKALQDVLTQMQQASGS